MKHNIHKILFVLFIVIFQLGLLYGTEIEIPFKGDKMIIIGGLSTLSISGSSSGIVKVNSSGNVDLPKKVDYVIDGNELKLVLIGRRNVTIEIPNRVNIRCHPVPIFFEGEFDETKDYGRVHMENIESEIEFNGDGYHVTIDNVSGPLSVVTYGNILGKIAAPVSNGMVLLDTYLGNVELVLPVNGTGNLECTALKGAIDISEALKPNYNSKIGTGTKIILHSENGALVKVKTNLEQSIEPTHPELREAFIKIFIEDQGKNRMDNESRRKLTAMGYGSFIDQQPEIHHGYPLLSKHRNYLDEVVAKYGFPTKEMIGGDYAMSAVRLIIVQGPKAYKLKYKDQFINAFGQRMYDIIMNKL